MLVLLVLVFIAIFALSAPGLIYQRQWKELAVFSGLVLFGFLLAFLPLIGFPLPSPNRIIASVIKSMTRLVTGN